MANDYYNPAPLVVVNGDTAVVEDINDVSNAIEAAFDLLVSDLGGDVTGLGDLTDNSMADTAHRHSELSASDGTPDAAWACDASGHLLPATTDTYTVGSISYTLQGLYCTTLETNSSGITAMNASSNVIIDLYRTTTAILSGDSLGYVRGRGWNGSTSGSGAAITYKATENWSVGNQGCKLEFRTNDNGESGSFGTVRMTVKEDGVINIANIPTSSAGLSSGDIWSNSGVLTIVA